MIMHFYFHLFFLVMLVVANIAVRLPALVGISLGMLVVSIVLHGVLMRRMFVMQQFVTTQPALSSELPSTK